MKNHLIKQINRFGLVKLVLVVFIIITANSCRKFLEVGNPKSRIVKEAVFSDDEGATSAVVGIYSDMMQTFKFMSSGITWNTGLSADELVYLRTSASFLEYYQNLISIDNSDNTTFWDQGYKYIYYANAGIEELRDAPHLTPKVRDQLLGEVLFIRAFTYFYLVNLYGDIPKIVSTNYIVNSTLPRSPVSEIYELILKDLEEANTLLTDDNVSAEKIRPDRWTVQSMLARVNLYLGNWDKALEYADHVIGSNRFQLDSINVVFLKASKETIWQLKPVNPWYNTLITFRLVPPNNTVLPLFPITKELEQSFDSTDLRKQAWLGQTFTLSGDYYYAYKYKVKVNYGTIPFLEYYIVFRLAELYLIRAEARAHLNDNIGALKDISKIRQRAGLLDLEDDGSDIFMLIEEARRKELFVEWGHRWLDLKRTNRVDKVMGDAKSTWVPDAALWPIPLSQRKANSNLTQNPGYE